MTDHEVSPPANPSTEPAGSTTPTAQVRGPEKPHDHSLERTPPPVLTVVLVRHGRSTANVSGILAGRTPGVGSTNTAKVRQQQLPPAGQRPVRSADLLPAGTVYADPGAVLAADRPADRKRRPTSRGRLRRLVRPCLKDLAQNRCGGSCRPTRRPRCSRRGKVWPPCRLGRPTDPLIRQAATADQTVLICAHGDVIKAILADALGLHLDAFQRIVVAPASISVIRYTPLRPFVERINDTGDPILARPSRPDLPGHPIDSARRQSLRTPCPVASPADPQDD